MNCRVCGTVMPDGAMFCGECGSSVAATRVLHTEVVDRRASDTTIIQPLSPTAVRSPIVSVPVSESVLAGRVGQSDVEGFGDEDRGGDKGRGGDEDRVGDDADRYPESTPDQRPAVAQTDTPERPLAGAAPDGEDVVPVPVVDATHPPEALPGEPNPGPSVPLDDSGTIFTLTMSTGGTALVAGSGLLGRRPQAQPGESFDALIVFADPDRSVSKTHLQFGLEGTELWISDRYSANGTVIRPPGGVARLCEPGRRYRVGRGTQVEIGEQYFDVS